MLAGTVVVSVGFALQASAVWAERQPLGSGGSSGRSGQRAYRVPVDHPVQRTFPGRGGSGGGQAGVPGGSGGQTGRCYYCNPDGTLRTVSGEELERLGIHTKGHYEEGVWVREPGDYAYKRNPSKDYTGTVKELQPQGYKPTLFPEDDGRRTSPRFKASDIPEDIKEAWTAYRATIPYEQKREEYYNWLRHADRATNPNHFPPVWYSLLSIPHVPLDEIGFPYGVTSPLFLVDIEKHRAKIMRTIKPFMAPEAKERHKRLFKIHAFPEWARWAWWHGEGKKLPARFYYPRAKLPDPAEPEPDPETDPEPEPEPEPEPQPDDDGGTPIDVSGQLYPGYPTSKPPADYSGAFVDGVDCDRIYVKAAGEWVDMTEIISPHRDKMPKYTGYPNQKPPAGLNSTSVICAPDGTVLYRLEPDGNWADVRPRQE
ncbi:MAG: hypothetical protein COV75_03150 [Candidatus Omnitrophica bacterium CG11_big_fil_rev_8_21_14_0_20_63_9]|nr:MAG: hypothetical protein COV75_03150 [Candidatus Omnitrophica bacterium CG11_big_fil_rev_8_21_14_0_20_63_9]